MRIVYLDTETSGFKPGQICQLTYIVEEDTTIIKRVNQFFKVDLVEDGAAKVTGLTKELLDTLSDGSIFANRAQEFYNDLAPSLIIAHNAAFDNRFVSAEMERVGINYFFKPKFCTMEYMTNIVRIPGRYGKFKWPSVGESMSYLGITESEVSDFAKWLYGDSAGMAHDARFDTSALYLMVRKMRRSQILNLEHIILING